MYFRDRDRNVSYRKTTGGEERKEEREREIHEDVNNNHVYEASQLSLIHSDYLTFYFGKKVHIDVF